MQRSNITLLPSSTIAKLRSSLILTSLPQIVSELVQNSLDAGAQSISIGVDCEDWSCYVQDDGCGISRNSLSAIGRPADKGRYSTSKGESSDLLQSFGFRGEALASASAVSYLEICSRTADSPETWSIIMKGSEKVYEGQAIRWRRTTSGTTVSVRDAFYNLPVRRRSHPPPSKTLGLIHQELVLHALMFPEVSFALENTHNNNLSASGPTVVARYTKTNDILSRFRKVFGKALADHVEEIDSTEDGIHISGFVSLHGAPNKAYQFLYVNRHPTASAELHRVIDKEFASSNFGKNALDDAGEALLDPRASSTKAERKPVYCLNITLPPSSVDRFFEPAKNTSVIQSQERVLNLLSTVVRGILVKNGFRPLHRDQQDPSPSPTKRRRIEDIPSIEVQRRRQLPSPEKAAFPPMVQPYASETGDEDRNIAWTNPSTGETFIVDARTGNSRVSVDGTWNRSEMGGSANRRTIPLDQATSSSCPSWITDALEVNKCFPQVESSVPLVPVLHREEPHSISDAFPPLQEIDVSIGDLAHATVISQIDNKFIVCLVGGGQERNQSTTAGRLLVLVDQHAADERVRVERYLEKLCAGFIFNMTVSESEGMEGIATTVLDPPHLALLTRHEAQFLRESEILLHFMRAWGFMIHLEEPSFESEEFTQVSVSTVPQVVSQKFGGGENLRELLKEVIAEPPSALPTFDSSIDTFWVQALRWMPRHLLGLASSRACRGAIMFNDHLTRPQCERLLRRLVGTAFPFQCAHGRPSLTPLVGIDQHMRKWSPTPIRWQKFEEEVEMTQT